MAPAAEFYLLAILCCNSHPVRYSCPPPIPPISVETVQAVRAGLHTSQTNRPPIATALDEWGSMPLGHDQDFLRETFLRTHAKKGERS